MGQRAMTPRPVREALDALADARRRREAATRRTAAALGRLPDSVAVAEMLGVPHGRADVYHVARSLHALGAARRPAGGRQ